MFVDRRGSREGKKTSLRQTDKAKKHVTTAPANIGQGLMRTCVPANLLPSTQAQPIFDAGCNLVNRQFENDFQRVVTRAMKDGVTGMVMVPNDFDKVGAAITLCKWLPGVLYCAAGIHPNNISSKKLSDKQFAQMVGQLREKLLLPEVAAVLCGVDFTRDVGLRVPQEKFLREELKMAGELDLPLSEEEEDEMSILLEIIKECREQFKEGLVHNFYGSASQLKQFIDLGLHVSISGIVTTEKHAPVVNIIPQIPRDKFLICTDSPYHTPQNISDSFIRESRNEPSNLPSVLQVCAKAYGVTTKELSDLVQKNSTSFFNLDAKSTDEEKKEEKGEKADAKDKGEVKGSKKVSEKKASKKGSDDDEEEEQVVKGKNEKSEKSVKSTKGSKGKGKKESDEEIQPKKKGGQQPPKKVTFDSDQEDEEEEEEIPKPKKGRHKESDEETPKSKKAARPKGKKPEPKDEEEEVIRPKKAKGKGKRYDDSSDEDVTVKEDFIKKDKSKEEVSTKPQKEQPKQKQLEKETEKEKEKPTKATQTSKGTKEITSDVKNLKISDDEDSDESVESGVVAYACKMCRTKLFTSENLQSHQTVQGLIDGMCRMFFLDKMDWMKGAVDADGRLACPKCSQKLGRFDANGISCSCGEIVKPAYKVQKSRIDAMGETTVTDSDDQDLQFGDSKKKKKKKAGGTKKATKGNFSKFRNKDYSGAKKRETDSDE